MYSNITVGVINEVNLNKENHPHRVVDDICFILQKPARNEEETRQILTFEDVKNLDIPEDALWMEAMKNTQATSHIISLNKLLGLPKMKGAVELIVCSNQELRYGAGVIGNKKVMEAAAEIVGCSLEDALIIPSSVHEVLLLNGKAVNPADVNDVICSVNGNTSCVPKGDMLSDGVFVYFGNTLQKKQLVAA